MAAIKAARRETKDKRADARLKALELRAEGMELSEVSQATGFHAAYVSQLVAKYRDHGLEAISGNHYGGNHRNMSFEEEAAILAPFKARAEKGELVEISEIETAYQQAVGHSIGTSQIYYVLHRHGWRKVMPRSRHPKKASEEVIETSFRNLKHTLGLLHLHAKKVEFVLQEIFAKLTMYNFCELITQSVVIRQAQKTHTYKVNFSDAVHICRQFFLGDVPPPILEAMLMRYISPIRLGRKDTRKLTQKSSASFTYRVA